MRPARKTSTASTTLDAAAGPTNRTEPDRGRDRSGLWDEDDRPGYITARLWIETLPNRVEAIEIWNSHDPHGSGRYDRKEVLHVDQVDNRDPHEWFCKPEELGELFRK